MKSQKQTKQAFVIDKALLEKTKQLEGFLALGSHDSVGHLISAGKQKPARIQMEKNLCGEDVLTTFLSAVELVKLWCQGACAIIGAGDELASIFGSATKTLRKLPVVVLVRENSHHAIAEVIGVDDKVNLKDPDNVEAYGHVIMALRGSKPAIQHFVEALESIRCCSGKRCIKAIFFTTE